MLFPYFSMRVRFDDRRTRMLHLAHQPVLVVPAEAQTPDDEVAAEASVAS